MTAVPVVVGWLEIWAQEQKLDEQALINCSQLQSLTGY